MGAVGHSSQLQLVSVARQEIQSDPVSHQQNTPSVFGNSRRKPQNKMTEERLLHQEMSGVQSGGSQGRKVALLTGITGQDGSYLAEFLLEKGYEVHGIIRRSSSFNTGRIAHLYDDPKAHKEGRMILHYGDLIDGNCLVHIINTTKPTEIYNLGAQSHVKVSFDLAEYTAEVDGVGTLRLLDAIRTCGLSDSVKFYQASTSELYGKVQEVPQKETTPFYPESPRRGETFVTRKVTRSLAKIHLGQMESFELGNLDSMRDWGHARDYVEGMWLMLQQDKPDDFVLATGHMHSVREFVEAACEYIGMELEWEGSGDSEIAKEKKTGIVRLRVNPKFYRPTEVEQLLGDPAKAKTKLGWAPRVDFKALV